MRQAIGTTWIFQLVIVFMLIFVAFLALSINYTKAFKIKNELITIMEKYEGVSDSPKGSLSIINNYLRSNNYGTMNTCQEGEYGAADLTDVGLEEVQKGKKYFYCVQKLNTGTLTIPSRSKYLIRIFFRFSLPVLGDMFTFSVEGKTIDINYPTDDIEYYYD